MDDVSLREALAAHRAIEPVGGAFTVTAAALDNEVAVAYGELLVTITLPSLREVVRDDDPADVVVEGWFDALRRHLVDGYTVASAEPAADAAVVHGRNAVEVTYRLRGDDAGTLADDAKALVDFAVGTYLQSAIPGYEYDEPMRGLLGKARERGRSEVDP